MASSTVCSVAISVTRNVLRRELPIRIEHERSRRTSETRIRRNKLNSHRSRFDRDFPSVIHRSRHRDGNSIADRPSIGRELIVVSNFKLAVSLGRPVVGTCRQIPSLELVVFGVTSRASAESKRHRDDCRRHRIDDRICRGERADPSAVGISRSRSLRDSRLKIVEATHRCESDRTRPVYDDRTQHTRARARTTQAATSRDGFARPAHVQVTP